MNYFGVTLEGIRDAAFGVDIPSGSDVDRQIERLIAKAEMLLPMACIDRRIASGELTTDEVASIIEDMVVRVTKNAGGIRRESVDDYTVELDSAITSGALYLSPGERARLCPSPNSGRGRVGSIRIAVPMYRAPGH